MLNPGRDDAYFRVKLKSVDFAVFVGDGGYEGARRGRRLEAVGNLRSRLWNFFASSMALWQNKLNARYENYQHSN